MRGNIPTDSDFDATLPVVDERSPDQKLSEEQKKLAKIGNSPQWKIISEYLDERIKIFQTGLFGEDLSGKSTSVIGERFLAAQSVVAEFESLKNTVNETTESVNEAVNEEKRA